MLCQSWWITDTDLYFITVYGDPSPLHKINALSPVLWTRGPHTETRGWRREADACLNWMYLIPSDTLGLLLLLWLISVLSTVSYTYFPLIVLCLTTVCCLSLQVNMLTALAYTTWITLNFSHQVMCVYSYKTINADMLSLCSCYSAKQQYKMFCTKVDFHVPALKK